MPRCENLIANLVDNHSHLQYCCWQGIRDGSLAFGGRLASKSDFSSALMYICICNAVTDKMIKAAAAAGASSLDDLNRMTGCAGGCGSCTELAEEILRGARKPLPAGLTLVAQAA